MEVNNIKTSNAKDTILEHSASSSEENYRPRSKVTSQPSKDAIHEERNKNNFSDRVPVVGQKERSASIQSRETFIGQSSLQRCKPDSSHFETKSLLERRSYNLKTDRADVQNWLLSMIDSWNGYDKLVVTVNFNKEANWDNGVPGRTDNFARNEMVRFCKRLDKLFYGKNAVKRKNARLPRIPILENGVETKWHCHIILGIPQTGSRVANSQDMESLIEQEWLVSDFSAKGIFVQPFDNGTINYLTKSRSKDSCTLTLDSCVLDAFIRMHKI